MSRLILILCLCCSPLIGYAEDMARVSSAGYILGNGMKWKYAMFFQVVEKNKQKRLPLMRAYADVVAFTKTKQGQRFDTAIFNNCIIVTSYKPLVSQSDAIVNFANASRLTDLIKVVERSTYFRMESKLINADFPHGELDKHLVNKLCRG